MKNSDKKTLISFTLNGASVAYNIPSNLRVVDLLREYLNLIGTKEACGSGECGACTILVNGESKLSCLMSAIQLKGKNIVTIEGLSKRGKLHPIQKAFIEKGAVQCGFCTPGMILATVDMFNRYKNLTRRDIRAGISGNLCRCTGYEKIVDAIESIKEYKQKSFQNSLQAPEINISDNIYNLSNIFMPATLKEFWEIKQANPNAVVYAGGTDVLTKRRETGDLICIERIKELKKITEQNDEIFIGSTVTLSELAESKIIAKNFSVLQQAISVLGSPPIRHMATIGGNICTASPAGDTLPCLYILDAVMEIRSDNSIREVAIKDFIKEPGKLNIKNNEILYRIKIRKKPDFNFHYFEKVGQRNALSISIVNIAIIAKISTEKIIENIKIAWGSVGPLIVRSQEIEKKLKGRKITYNNLKSVFELIEKKISPIDDIRAGKNYRTQVAKNLLLRLLEV